MEMNLFHPTRRRLRRWMADPRPDRVEKHLSGCERCSDRLAAPDGPPTVADLLAAFVEPPDGLEDQMVEQVTRRELESRDMLAFFVDLLGVWWDTGRVVFGPEATGQAREDG
jgi:hypothetical protein